MPKPSRPSSSTGVTARKSPTISTTLWTAILDPATLQGALAMLVQDNREFLAAGSASQGS